MKRDVSIELYRCFLMFGICWLHCCSQGGRFEETKWIYYLMRPCVVGFVFISGWFGLKLNVRKVAALLFTGATCAVIAVGMKIIICRDGRMAEAIYSFVNGYWFLWAYLVLLLISPIINAALEGDRTVVNHRIFPLLLIVFGWSFLTHIPIIKGFVPASAGVTAQSFLMMVGVYAIARIVRDRGYDHYLRGGCFWFLVFCSIIMCALGFSHYDSPFALLVAIGAFQLVRKVNLPCGFFSIVILMISPSMFAVYILHQTFYGFQFVRYGMKVSGRIITSDAFFQTLCAAILVFFSCIALDICRRVCISGIIKLLKIIKK